MLSSIGDRSGRVVRCSLRVIVYVERPRVEEKSQTKLDRVERLGRYM